MGNPELGGFTILDYKKIIVYDFLCGTPKELKSWTEDDDTSDSYYTAVTSLYPIFILDNICTDLNAIEYLNSIAGVPLSSESVESYIRSRGFLPNREKSRHRLNSCK